MVRFVVLDASVVVAGARPREPGHAKSRSWLVQALAGEIGLVEPCLFFVEVGATLARAGERPAAIRSLLAALRRRPHEMEPTTQTDIDAIVQTAIKNRLRGADAHYVWVAATRGVELITLDAEMLERSKGTVRVRQP